MDFVITKCVFAGPQAQVKSSRDHVSAECQFDFEKAAIEQLGGYILAVCFDKDNLGINWREQTLRWLVVK